MVGRLRNTEKGQWDELWRELLAAVAVCDEREELQATQAQSQPDTLNTHAARRAAASTATRNKLGHINAAQNTRTRDSPSWAHGSEKG